MRLNENQKFHIYENIKIHFFFVLMVINLFALPACSQFNASICGYIEMNDVYYFINSYKSDRNVQKSSELNPKNTLIFNYCHQLQYWCHNENRIVTASLIQVDDLGNCKAYRQQRIETVNPNNISQGIKVIYTLKGSTEFIQQQYPCTEANRVGCPQVSRTTLWNYFSNNSLSYTIAIEVIGVLFMILGVYMYRVTLVILGWATAFIILLSIEQTVVFVPGVPEQDLANVMIITIICSFFVGYVLAYFPKGGLFCMGMWIGLIISLTLNNIALYLIYSTPQNLPLYIVLPVLCLAFGILTVCVKRKFIIFATSLIGAYICLRALSWHLGAFPNQLLYPQEYRLGLKGIVVWQFYLYVVALLILTASSSALQFWLFKKKSQKTNGPADIDEHFNQMQNKLDNQRQKLIQFQFQNIFKKLKNETKKPRVLKKGSDDDENDQYQVKKNRNSINRASDSFVDEDQQNQPSEFSQEEYKKPKPTKDNGLKDTLLQKGSKKKS